MEIIFVEPESLAVTLPSFPLRGHSCLQREKALGGQPLGVGAPQPAERAPQAGLAPARSCFQLGVFRSQFLAALSQPRFTNTEVRSQRILNHKQDFFLNKGHFCLQNFHFAKQEVGSVLGPWQRKVRGLSVLTRERRQEPGTHKTQCWVPPSGPASGRQWTGREGRCGADKVGMNRLLRKSGNMRKVTEGS